MVSLAHESKDVYADTQKLRVLWYDRCRDLTFHFFALLFVSELTPEPSQDEPHVPTTFVISLTGTFYL